MTSGTGNLSAEAKALLDVLAARLEAAAQPGAPAHGERCTGCPICAAITYLKEHRELSGQLASGALLIVGALRQYLDHAPTGTSPSPTREPVQHIDIT